MAFDYTAARANQVDKTAAGDMDVKAAKTYDFNDIGWKSNSQVYGATGTDAAYSSSWVAYACIRRLARDAAGIPLLYLSDPNDPDSAVPDTNPTKQLFLNPSPYFSTSEMIQWLVTMENMRGEFFMPFDNNIRPQYMIPQTDPRHWKDVVDGLELVQWQYQHSDVQFSRLPEEVIHATFINPNSMFRGQSPIAAAATAFGIEQGADKLTLNIVRRGGEQAILFEDTLDATEQQLEQATNSLRARRQGVAMVPSDSIIPYGLKPIDPKFATNESSVLEAAEAQPGKIAAVYGVPRSMIDFGSEEKFENARIKKRTYYDDTVVPMLKGMTDAFDRVFVDGFLGPRYNCYVRFDWKSVPAMQEDLSARFEMAGKGHKDGLPWGVLNDRFELGLDVAKIPGADRIMVSSALAPLDQLIKEWDTAPTSPKSGAAEPSKSAESDSGGGGLTQALIRKRASNTRSRVNRAIRLAKAEKDLRAEWKALLTGVMNKAAKAAAGIKTSSGASAALKPAFKGLGEKMAKLALKYHEIGAAEGVRSIIELVEGKMSDASINMLKAEVKWDPEVRDFLRDRENLIKGMDDILFEDVKNSVEAAVLDGKSSADVQHVVRDRMKSAPGGINRAVTIARTEVGTAYNVARFSEMKNQDFEEAEWQTKDDELVRTTPPDQFDHAVCDGEVRKLGKKKFPNGLYFPQEPGGEAGNVINCRCELIPVVRLPK